jgi:hypothetical protein
VLIAVPEPSPLEGLLGGDLLARLERFAAESRVDLEAARRSRERWLRQQADETAAFVGVLADLAERRAVVAMQTRAGHAHQGELRAIGADFCLLRPWTARHDTIVTMAAIAVVRTHGDEPVSGDRVLRLNLRLTDVLAGLAAERERVVVGPLHGGDTIVGALQSLGQDLVVVRLDADPPRTAYVPLSEIGEVRLAV